MSSTPAKTSPTRNAITRTICLAAPLLHDRGSCRASALLLWRHCHHLGLIVSKHARRDRARQRQRGFEARDERQDDEEVQEVISRGGLAQRDPARTDRRATDVAEDQNVDDQQ